MTRSSMAPSTKRRSQRVPVRSVDVDVARGGRRKRRLSDSPVSDAMNQQQSSMLASTSRSQGSTEVFARGGILIEKELPPPGPATFPHSNTATFILLWHVLFLYHWNKRRRRRSLVVNYRTLVQRKRFYQVWIALFSHPPAESGQQPPMHSEIATNNNDIAVEMGNEESSNTATPYPYLSLIQRRLDSHPITKSLRRRFGYLVWLCFHGNLSGLPLLAYNSHVLWSCRALEERYNNSNMPWNYSRVLLTWGILSFSIELVLAHVLFQRIVAVTGLVTQQRVRLEEGSLLQSIRTKILERPMSSPTTIAATVLLVFHLHFPHVPVHIMPGVGGQLFLKDVPSLCYFINVSILAVLSRYCHTLLGVFFGGFVALLWCAGLIDFLEEPRWNSLLTATFCVLTVLSLRVDDFYGKWFPCVEHVSWDSKGRFLVQNEEGLWLPKDDAEEEDDSSTDDTTYSSGSDHESDEELEESVASAFPTSNDREIYGSRRTEDDDLETGLSGDWIRSSQIMRARRGTNHVHAS